MTHTPGKLRLAPVSDYTNDINIDAGPSGFICTCGQRGDKEAEANAWRLVMAWNAFDGIDTADIPELAAKIKELRP